MASKGSYNHAYINDGITYNSFVFDDQGNHIRVSRIWERWQHHRPTGAGPVKQIQSYDNGYVLNNINNVLVCGAKDMMYITTRMGRRLPLGIDASVITTKGPTRVRDLGIGTKLLTVDCYKYYWGDTLKLESNGNARVRALLRNHEIEFSKLSTGSTSIDGWVLHCHDFDTDRPVVEGNIITYGLNNYRESIKELLNLPDAYTKDEIVGVRYRPNKKYAIAIYMDSPQNVILENGLIMQSTQTAQQHD